MAVILTLSVHVVVYWAISSTWSDVDLINVIQDQDIDYLPIELISVETNSPSETIEHDKEEGIASEENPPIATLDVEDGTEDIVDEAPISIPDKTVANVPAEHRSDKAVTFAPPPLTPMREILKSADCLGLSSKTSRRTDCAPSASREGGADLRRTWDGEWGRQFGPAQKRSIQGFAGDTFRRPQVFGADEHQQRMGDQLGVSLPTLHPDKSFIDKDWSDRQPPD